jgi:hypothetical protein
MKIYRSQSEVERDIKDEILVIEGDVKFECSISIEASIKVICGNITAGDITAGDITAGDITAGDITARDILYYAFCCVYKSIKCLSIKAKREIHHEPICLEGKLEIKEPEPNLSGKEVSVTLDGKTYRAKIL